MLVTILGWFWICMGALFVLRPQIAKRMVEKKVFKKLRGILFLITVFLGSFLISIGWKYPGILPKILALFGIMAVIKGFVLLNVKTAEKLIEWSAKLPLLYYRIGGCIHVLIGVIILLLRR